MQIQAIKSFLLVYETQNMTKASERLFVTQQCLSRQMRSMEEELGTKLFLRQKTGVKPTELCRRLYPELQRLIGCYENALAVCGGGELTNAPKFIIALANGMSNYINFSALSELVYGFTGQELMIEELTSGECIRKLQGGECDMAFLLEPFDDTLLEHLMFRQDYGYIAMHKTHPLAKEPGPVPLAALDGIKIISGNSTNCAVEHFWRYCNQSGVYPRCVASVSDTTGFVNKLTQGDVVVTILSRSIADVTNPNVVFRQIVDPPLVGNCHCCVRSSAENVGLLRGLMQKIKESYVPDKAYLE